jgi:hypothetical protein
MRDARLLMYTTGRVIIRFQVPSKLPGIASCILPGCGESDGAPHDHDLVHGDISRIEPDGAQG